MDEMAQFWLAVITLAVVVLLLVPILTIVAMGAIVGWFGGARARRGTWILLLALYLLSPFPRIVLGFAFYGIEPLRMPLVRADLALSHIQREIVVGMVERGELPEQTDRDLALPWWARGLSVHGTVATSTDGCGRVFFMTLTGMSPDPYAGFEYVPDRCPPEPDPLGSGSGIATDLGGHWFWIVAR